MTEPTAGLLAKLEAEWTQLTTALNVSDSGSRLVWTELCSAYGEPWRHYHDLWHIDHMLGQLARYERPAADLNTLRLATWFHDVVYKPKASDNEEASAHRASLHLTNWQLVPVLIREIDRLIILTKSHRTSEQDTLGHIILDADLAILGEDRLRYELYARQIRNEYSWVDAASYAQGRSRILRTFSDRPRIYLTPQMAHREQIARDNLNWELERLGTD